MSTIRAVYEGGVFRPVEPVDLPEGSVVEFLDKATPPAGPSIPNLDWDEKLDAVYEILSRRYSGGDPSVSARHNEHQP